MSKLEELIARLCLDGVEYKELGDIGTLTRGKRFVHADAVENGIPLVNSIPISNLSEGEKLQLCVDVTLSDNNNLKLILIDGTEKLSEENRKKLYAICKEKGLTVIATRTTDNPELNIIEL